LEIDYQFQVQGVHGKRFAWKKCSGIYQKILQDFFSFLFGKGELYPVSARPWLHQFTS
jgi:hypothetical protein